MRLNRSALKPIVARLSGTALVLLTAQGGFAQVLYHNNAGITVTAGGSITVKGDVKNASGTITNLGTLTISGNTENNGTLTTPAGSTLKLTGTTRQVLSGSSAINANNIELNNAAGITLNTPLNVSGAMTFTAGVITDTLAAAPVVFAAGATIANTPTNASHIDGFVRKLGTGAFVFPTGNATNYQPVGLNLSANASGVTARYFAADAGTAPFGTGGSSAVPLVAYNKNEYWDVVPVSTATGTVTIYFDGYNNQGIGNTADLRVAHKSGGQYLNEGGTPTGTVAGGSVTGNSISSFSPFTLGSVSAASPLPVQLLAFSGTLAGSANALRWQVAAQAEGTLFQVQRSADGAAFQDIGAATTATTFLDVNPLPVVSYYRLQLRAAGGESSFSQTVALRRSPAGEGVVTVYPQPVSSELTLKTEGTALDGTTATILNVQGQVVATVQLAGKNTLDVRAWPAGVYAIRFADGSTATIVKQ